MIAKKSRVTRAVKAFVIITFLAVIGIPSAHLVITAAQDRDSLQQTLAGHADDASRLNAVRVEETWAVPKSPRDAERQLVELLHRARRD